MKTSTIFRNKWAALAWAAVLLWTVYGLFGPDGELGHKPDPAADAKAQQQAALIAAKLDKIQHR